MTANEINDSAVEGANRVYFQVLAATRASLGRFATLALPIIVVLGVLSFGFNELGADKGHEVLPFVRDINLVMIGLSAAFLLLSVFKRLLYRFQVFFSAVLAAMALGLVYAICLLPLPLVAFLNVSDKDVSVMLFSVGGLVGLIFLVGSIGVHVLMLRHRLRVGHSEKRTIGNYVAVSKSNRSKIFWIIFGLVTVVPNVLTSGQYLMNDFAAIGLVFFACVTPSLPVEFAYLAYLKSKDRVYWEARPPGLPKEERRRLTRKIVLWVVGIVVALAAFWVFAKYFTAGV